MNGQETVKWLESLRTEIGKSEHGDLWHYAEAIDLTIKALGQMESEKSCDTCKYRKLYECSDCRFASKWEPTTDCISRQQAIESLDLIDSLDTEADREYARDIFRNIPPVEPKIYGNEHNCIMTMFGECSYPETGCGDCAVVEKVRDALKNECQPVEPKQSRGRWVPVRKVYITTKANFPETHIEWEIATEPDDVDAVRCSECGEVFDFEDARNWCTECGAMMKGGKE